MLADHQFIKHTMWHIAIIGNHWPIFTWQIKENKSVPFLPPLTLRSSKWAEPILTFTFTFIRRFYPKRLTVHSSDSFYILSALAFPGNRTHDLGVANAMLYQLSYRKAILGGWNRSITLRPLKCSSEINQDLLRPVYQI